MNSKNQFRSLLFRTISSAATAAMTMAIVFALTFAASQPAQAQTFKVLHTFTGGQDGANPYAGVTLDRGGNLYGTAYYGGIGYGTVYQLKHKGSGWTFNPLFSFNYSDRDNPAARVIFGPNGTLYGTTYEGGIGAGTVFNLRPSATACKTALCPWTETVLYSFEGSPTDGGFPDLGDLIFEAGNIYGTTYAGGNSGIGTVYELTPSGSGYTESPLYAFSGNDGENPANGVIFDSAGNLYSTTAEGGLSGGWGTLFELTKLGSSWTETFLYSFQNGNDGAYPYSGLIFDQLGNLYGATSYGGLGGGGTVFKLTPFGLPGSWTVNTLYSFTGATCNGSYGTGPLGTLVMDGAGNFYGTTFCDGANKFGSVFKLTPSGPPWTYTSLHDFTGGSDGAYPISNVVFDASGNLYGTASDGGAYNFGVVWEITP